MHRELLYNPTKTLSEKSFGTKISLSQTQLCDRGNAAKARLTTPPMDVFASSRQQDSVAMWGGVATDCDVVACEPMRQRQARPRLRSRQGFCPITSSLMDAFTTSDFRTKIKTQTLSLSAWQQKTALSFFSLHSILPSICRLLDRAGWAQWPRWLVIVRVLY